ncbi:GntR family transcriptional regulator [Roseovarius sp. LXJ103]|uniref:GntR family transcriptional regulator n=1 Tax=Roseovarius carneus TaxID=2853164 RepID=UPI000D617876|nr:GntR family transcriptional regulator [Roseovarius carneus]MBZ8118012.1 GntR family transcriptional regulator [Roseovarius carneus]PWE36239.1 GntR family transcriptional regulator [Pelagicola sp. LXJ1103]
MQQQVANWDDASTGTGEAGLPAHELIYRQLREMILFGDLTPGQAVTIQGLTAELGAGMTPVREAIRRLTSQGALEFQGNRRVSVPLLKTGDIDEMIVAREWLDPYLTRRAALAASGTDADQLAEIDAALDLAIRRGDLRAYLQGNYEFHMMLYTLAGSPLLAELAEGLWLRFGPSMRVVCGRMGTQNLPDNHKAAIAALRAADPDAAAEAIERDVRQGMEQLRLSLEPPVAAT